MAIESPIIVARFWSKVAVGKDGECWPWQASTDSRGYGQFKGAAYVNPQRAHRVAYRLVYGEFNSDRVIRHLCNNPGCCNPAHLRAGTQAENHADREAAGRAPREAGRFLLVDGAA